MTSSRELILFLWLWLSLAGNTNGECWTVKNEKCIFPFTYKGLTHNSCTKADSENGAYWCATEVQSNGKVVNGKWEDCDFSYSICHKECLTIQNKPCVFPFTFKGEVHNQCTQVDSENGAYWCATKVNKCLFYVFCRNISLQVDGTGQVVRNAWADCRSSCARECVRWVAASDGDIPPQAYRVNQYTRELPQYVVRAQHEGGIYPGTFLPQLGEVDIPWRGQVITKSNYQVLRRNIIQCHRLYNLISIKVMVENTNQNCLIDWVDEGLTRDINEEIFKRNLVVGGHNGSSIPTFICAVFDDNRG